jgi:hypothetical protein
MLSTMGDRRSHMPFSYRAAHHRLEIRRHEIVRHLADCLRHNISQGQVIIQGFLFSVTFGCQCVFLGNLLQWSNESAFDFVPHNLMVLFLALVPRALFGSENLNRIFGVSMFFGGIAGILIGPPIASICLFFYLK